MGKNLQHQESRISMENHSLGCMSGILHHFHHNRWHTVKKRLPHKKHASGKQTTNHEITRTTPDAVEMHGKIDSALENFEVETQSPRRSPKSSMKSRIKSLITEEVSKRRGRHRRSSSCPIRTQLDRTNSIHHLESSNPESPIENNSKNEVLRCHHDNVHSISLLETFSPKAGEEHRRNTNSCEFCAAMFTMNYLKQTEVNKIGRGPVRDHTLLQDKSMYAIEPSKNTSLQESKLFMDALDLLNMRKEMFLKILQDPSSSLAHQLQCRRGSNLRFGLTKSVSFPAIRSCINVIEGSYKHLGTAKGPFTERGCQEGIELSEDASSPTSANNMLRKRRDNKVALKRFKDLREKIKNVIRDRKKEKNRIVMDGVLHKIPFGGDRMNQDFKVSDFGKSPSQRFKRASSFNESYDRYNRLLENGFNKEAKDHVSERLRSRTGDTLSPIPSGRATLERILSLPDLRCYSYFQIDDSPSSSSLHTPVRIAAGRKPSLSLDSENKIQLINGVSESESQDNLFDVEESFCDSADSKTWESASSHDLNLEPVTGFGRRPSQSDEVSENESNYQEYEIGPDLPVSVSEDSQFARGHIISSKEDSLSENKVASNTLESQITQLYDNLLHVHVDTKNESIFNYVKNILELSGFSRDEILGKWHSADHPLDPSVYEEVEGCLVAQPECSGNKEGGTGDHLLLFDLINEVLLNIYERSFCYWPMSLTCKSHIHRMPMGYHVLEEVWAEISWLLRWEPEIDPAIDDAVSRDLSKGDGWMSLQFDAECVGLEVEDLIFDDLIEEIIFA
ncbi:hypothetical protein BUALT_Bualt11G0120300 [Buddleja alternifolia]|uniref:DUF4378 domain-containing protein n=1 Tax=Buddleja alternifolia TaxID=168488 RepID=A0AAV6X2F8_9LAMI|nr:hypothetical protein BUALT_Bualt11G0120300 [Buddleja alternifolia]